MCCSIAAGSIAVPLVELVPLRTERQQAGAVALMDRICRSLPPRAVVMVVKSPNYNDLVQPVHAFCGVPESDWKAIRAEVEKASLLEAEWGWTPPKRIFDTIRDAAAKQKQPISSPPPDSTGTSVPPPLRGTGDGA